MSAPHILALDLSLTAAGYCRDGETGCIRTRRRGWDRIGFILGTVHGLTHDAELVVLEGYSYGSQGKSVYQIAELGGIVRYSLYATGMPVVEVAPSTLKKFATGKGNSPKDAMIAAAIRRFGFEGSDNNEADAFLLWCMARAAYGFPVAPVPLVNTAAVQVPEWPVLTVSADALTAS
jgi:Holliday junction resolvasome RuvABC endonuclease subunit